MHRLRSLSLGFGGSRVPVILQAEAGECGIACLAMVAGAHGHRVDLALLRKRLTLSMKGASMADLAHAAAAIDLQPRAVRADMGQLRQLGLPCILHWDFNHFVVLVEVRRDTALIHDPARGERVVALAEVSRHFTGVALELVPAAGFQPRVERQAVGLGALIGRVLGWPRAVAQILLLALVLEFFVLLTPFFMQWVVDDVLVSGDRELLLTLGLGFAMLVAMQAATAAIRSWAVLHLSATLNLHGLSNLFTRLLRLPPTWFERRHAGDIWSRFFALQQIQKSLSTGFLEAILDGLMVVVTLVMMALYSGVLTAIAVGAVAWYAALRWACFGAMRRATEESLVHDARKSSHFLESLRGVMAIKLFSAEADRQSRFMNLVVDTMNADIVLRKFELMLGSANRLVFGLERVIGLWVGALLVLDQHFSVGMLLAFVAYKEQFAVRVGALIDKASEWTLLRVQADRVADIVLAEPERAEDGCGLPDAGVPRIELRGVSFAYSDNEPPVLRNINLVIEPGESVAIVGASGCGKSTLLKLLLGIARPQQGQILIGGQPVERVGLAAWRRATGTVMQEDCLFAGSVAENISFFDPHPDLERIRECARSASIHDEIIAMTMGYHTLVGDMGDALSGGQRQRVLLARALYKQPRVLLLDEATSSLDVDRERLVNQAVRQLDLTRIIVAHRPETIASVGRVIALDGGSIAHDLRCLSSPGRTLQ
jgi:ATP-binding cassette subfamily B protein RaxB